ncbi:hypothetical protein BGW36DRAFT_284790 [Talaromyces proteolyticus]|uniref:C2H2-type domain-containing protein n=1 Tax=Talaromyces proteolyticus TaxID=1131652 RepID=A0AAD4Q3L4_9EURO|nr:uncharacterized protein BGW36DRAFT_284790 [Talaromyces proteolyticus]KAH8705159.1 hypothetical protein BGW36DRAFT_284790 [Talaromyces proteolyticus]
MSAALELGDLLRYDAEYKVLICRECKYAIQKNALGSHLLRHKIYRGERQRLLSSISQLHVLDPDDVRSPFADCPPVDGLPVIAGYKCLAPGCGSLCASFKRMRHHWSTTHALSNPSDDFACSVDLQTFFRGTKLRYFEVSRSTSVVGPSLVPDCQDSRIAQQDSNLVVEPKPHAKTSVLPRSALSGSILPGFDFDLEALRYFHHFVTTTSLTLPARDYRLSTYWQTDVIEQALQLRWLMCGVLAISASHMAARLDVETTKQMHLDRSAQFQLGFLAGWNEMKHSTVNLDTEELKTGAQMICIQRCCQWTLAKPNTPDQNSLELFTASIRGCIDSNFALCSEVSGNSFLVNASIPLVNVENENSGVGNHSPPALLEHLRSLPYRMAEPLGKPDDPLDVMATLQAVETLVDCCLLTYRADEVGTVWIGMESWLRRVPRHFEEMILRRAPAALIVLGHWLVLVERAEHYCWVLKGLAVRIMTQISGDLPEEYAIQSLVAGLIG